MRLPSTQARAGNRRRSLRTDWRRKLIATVRRLWAFAWRVLLGQRKRQAVESLIGVAALAVDGLALGAMLLG
jgi:hypothetical protein